MLFNRQPFDYLGDKSDPVKNTLLVLAIAGLAISFHSCSDVAGSNINKPLDEIKAKKEKKEKKPIVVVKAKKRENKKTPAVLPKTDKVKSENNSPNKIQ